MNPVVQKFRSLVCFVLLRGAMPALAIVVAIVGGFDVSKARAEPPNVKTWAEISSPGSGVGGVFFVGNKKGKSVVKFVEESPGRVLFAESILGLVNVPTPQTVTYSKDSKEFKSIFEKITELQEMGSDRVKTVYENTVRQSAVVQVQTLIAGAGGSESVQGVLGGLNDYLGPLKDGVNEPVKTTVLLKDTKFTDRLAAVSMLLKALSDERQIEALGRLSVGDAYLGNEDRLQKPRLNLNNLMIDKDGKFVAIDNFSDAPDIESLAWEIKADQLANSGEQFGSKSKRVEAVEIAKKDWFKKIIQGYRMGSGILTANLDTAMNHDAESARIASVLKEETWTLLTTLSRINTALLPIKSGGSKVAGGINSISKEDAIWTLTIVTNISESKKSAAGAHLSTVDYKLDWNAVERSLAKGMSDATKLLVAASGVTRANMNDSSTDTFLKGAIGKQFPKIGTTPKGEIDAVTLHTRAKYLFLRTEEKKTNDQIEPRLLFTDVETKKEYKVTLWCADSDRGPIITKK